MESDLDLVFSEDPDKMVVYENRRQARLEALALLERQGGVEVIWSDEVTKNDAPSSTFTPDNAMERPTTPPVKEVFIIMENFEREDVEPGRSKVESFHRMEPVRVYEDLEEAKADAEKYASIVKNKCEGRAVVQDWTELELNKEGGSVLYKGRKPIGMKRITDPGIDTSYIWIERSYMAATN